MKRVKKIMALVLAMVMVLAMGVTTFAAGQSSITLHNAVSGHTYTAYQILKGDVASGKLSNVVWGNGITDKGIMALNDKYIEPGTARTAGNVAAAIVGSSDAGAIEFANTVLPTRAAISENLKDGIPGSVVDETTDVVFSNLEDGYYMIVDTWNGTDSDLAGKDYTLARYMVQLAGRVEVNNKADKPTVDKVIVEDNTEKDQNTANIGDTVNFKVKSAVPEYVGYKEYYMDFTDTLSKGFDFNGDTNNETTVNGVQVKIGDTTLPANAFEVTVREYSETDGTSIVIHIKDIVSREYAVGAPIEVTYSATVNKAAEIGTTSNDNTVKLQYSNDPLHSGNGTPDDTPDKDIVHGETPESTTKTFVTAIELTKVDGSNKGQKLSGAVFNIKGSQINKVLVTGEKFVEAEAGEYYLLTDNTYTKEVPTEATKDQYVVVGTEYKRYNKTAYENTLVQETADKEFQAVTGADGIIRITGLKEGTYEFKEIQAPDGYNKLANPIRIVIGSRVDNGAFTWVKGTGSADVKVENGIFKFEVENNQGATLPSTGGMGTTLFYVLGSILLVGAVVLLVTKKRMSSEQ